MYLSDEEKTDQPLVVKVTAEICIFPSNTVVNHVAGTRSGQIRVLESHTRPSVIGARPIPFGDFIFLPFGLND